MRILNLTCIVLLTLSFINCGSDDVSDRIDDRIKEAAQTDLPVHIRIAAADSALVLVKSLHKHKIRETDLIRIIKAYYASKAFERILSPAAILTDIASKNKDTTRLAIANHFIGRYYGKIGKLDSAYYHHRKAEVFYSIDGPDLNAGANYLDIAALQLRIEDHTNCEESLNKAVEYFGTDEYGSAGLYFANRMYSDIFSALEYFDRALFFQNEASKNLANTFKDFKKEYQSTLSFGTAVIYYKKRNCAKAMHHLKIALKHVPPDNTELRARIQLLQSDCYMKAGAFRNAQNTLRAISAGLASLDDGLKAEYHLKLWQWMKLNGRNDISLLRKADSLASAGRHPKVKLQALNALINQQVGDKYELSKEYIAIVDSLDKQERTGRSSFARIEFNHEELEVKTRKASKNVGLIFLIALVFLGITVVLYKMRVQWLKKRELLIKYQRQLSNESVYQLMRKKKEKIEKARKIENARIASNIKDTTVVRLGQVRRKLLEIENSDDVAHIDECLQYIEEIQKVEFQIRDVAHDLNQEIFSENVEFNSVLESLIDRYREKSKASFFLEVQPEINWNTTPAVIKINSYQIIEDLIKHSVHGKARNIFVTIVRQDDRLRIIVLDDGQGKDFLKIAGGSVAKNVLSRISSLSGSIDNKPRKGKGSTIIVNLPHHKHLQLNGYEN